MRFIDSGFWCWLLWVSLFSLSACGSGADGRSKLVVWNVGQGQWVTDVREDVCIHYDIGGEKDVSREVLRACSGRRLQILVLSHWDWDHISFARKFSLNAGRSCLWRWPLGSASPSKEKMLRQIPLCAEAGTAAKVGLVFSPVVDKKLASNDLSRVFLTKGGVLLPGDSTARMERRWASRLGEVRGQIPVRGLVLGHHGSRTSTSMRLLESLPRLKWAVASARKRRFGHPHPEVVRRLRDRGIPLLRTEDWGNIHFQQR